MKKSFKVRSRSGKEFYTVDIETKLGKLIKYNCECEHGSMWRFSKKATEENQKCWHVKRIMKIFKLEEANGNPN